MVYEWVRTVSDRRMDHIAFISKYLRYRRSDKFNEREIAHWEARTTETAKIGLAIGVCLEAVDKLSKLWEVNDDEDRQGLVRMLFQ